MGSDSAARGGTVTPVPSPRHEPDRRSHRRLTTGTLPAPRWCLGVGLGATLELAAHREDVFPVRDGRRPAQLLNLTVRVGPDGTLDPGSWTWLVVHLPPGAAAPAAGAGYWSGTGAPAGPVPADWAAVAAAGYPARLGDIFTTQAARHSSVRQLTDRDLELRIAALALGPTERLVAERLLSDWVGDAEQLASTARALAARPAA